MSEYYNLDKICKGCIHEDEDCEGVDFSDDLDGSVICHDKVIRERTSESSKEGGGGFCLSGVRRCVHCGVGLVQPNYCNSCGWDQVRNQPPRESLKPGRPKRKEEKKK